MNKPVLHLNLKRKWFDMIKSGKKTEEYRKQSKYWNRVFKDEGHIKIKGKYYHPTDVIICFSNGYAKNRAQFYCGCRGLYVKFGKEEWGAVLGEQYFCLSLDLQRSDHA